MKTSTSTLETLFDTLNKDLTKNGEKISSHFQGVVKFKTDDATWTLEIINDTRRLTKGDSDLEPDVELTASEENFIKLIMGQMTPQTAFMMGKLKLSGDIGLALKLQPIFQAARPRAKL